MSMLQDARDFAKSLENEANEDKEYDEDAAHNFAEHAILSVEIDTELADRLIAAIGSIDQLEMAVNTALNHDLAQMKAVGIVDATTFLKYASGLLKWVPNETIDGKEIYNVLCLFYFVLDQPPIGPMQNAINTDSIGMPASPISQWIVDWAIKAGEWLDQPESLTPQALETFKKSPKYNLQEALIPEGGWKSFNELFARKLQPGARPIAEPANDAVVTWPADATFDGAWPVDDNGIVTIKNIPWPVSALLQGSEYADKFAGGVWMHAFLNTTDYHRQHAPVAGKILEARVIQGLAYMEVDIVQDDDGKNLLKPHRSWKPKNRDIQSGEIGALDAPDNAGYQFLQTRGLILLDNPVLGLVALLPVGMAQVSSVRLTRKAGDVVNKGDELSYFQFGGSDVVMVFQSDAKVQISDLEMGQHYKMGNVLASSL